MLEPRKKLVRHHLEGAARFLTFSCYHRLNLFGNDRIKAHFVDLLGRSAREKSVEVLAWVVMPEHVHLVVLPARSDDVTAFLTRLKSWVASDVLKRWRERDAPALARLRDRSGAEHFWQLGGEYDRCVIGEELLEKIGYCHRNPVVRGLCATGIDLPWSSARAYEQRDDYAGPPVPFDQIPPSRRPLT